MGRKTYNQLVEENRLTRDLLKNSRDNVRTLLKQRDDLIRTLAKVRNIIDKYEQKVLKEEAKSRKK